MNSEIKTMNDTKADLDEKVPDLNTNNMCIISKNSSNDTITAPNEYQDDANYFGTSDNRITTDPASECLIDANILINKSKVQRTLSSTNKIIQRRSDDPRRGGRVRSDVITAQSTGAIEHE